MALTSVMGFGNLFIGGALILVALSFSTDHWVEYVFSREALRTAAAQAGATVEGTRLTNLLQNSPLTFTRYRGLFRTCYPGNETTFLESKMGVIEGHCLPELGYELFTAAETTVTYPASYTIRKHLMRSHVALFICAMFMLIIAWIAGLISCWKTTRTTIISTTILLFVAAFFTAGGMAFFHGYDYLETQTINLNFLPRGWPVEISSNTRMEYGWSYIIGWLGMSLCIVAAVLFIIASNIRPSKKRRVKEPFDDYYLEKPKYYHQPPPPFVALPARINPYRY